MSWNTLHIFGYGQVQLISNTENKLVDWDLCPSTQAVVDMVYSHKPLDSIATPNYRVVTLYNEKAAIYQTIDNSFRVDYSELDLALIEQLVSEIQNA